MVWYSLVGRVNAGEVSASHSLSDPDTSTQHHLYFFLLFFLECGALNGISLHRLLHVTIDTIVNFIIRSVICVGSLSLLPLLLLFFFIT